MLEKEYLAFDFDGDERNLRFKDLKIDKTRMADTKFEDDIEE